MKQAKVFNCMYRGASYSVGDLRFEEMWRGRAGCYICDKVLAMFGDVSVPVFWFTQAVLWPWAAASS